MIWDLTKETLQFIQNNKIDFRYIELMQTGDNLEYFKKYHASSKIFKNYLNENNWIYQTLGKDAGPSLNYINPEYKDKFLILDLLTWMHEKKADYTNTFCHLMDLTPKKDELFDDKDFRTSRISN